MLEGRCNLLCRGCCVVSGPLAWLGLIAWAYLGSGNCCYHVRRGCVVVGVCCCPLMVIVWEPRRGKLGFSDLARRRRDKENGKRTQGGWLYYSYVTERFAPISSFSFMIILWLVVRETERFSVREYRGREEKGVAVSASIQGPIHSVITSDSSTSRPMFTCATT